jgi:hypothetical protein
MSDLKQATQRKVSFLATMKAVFWSFLGIRKKMITSRTPRI